MNKTNSNEIRHPDEDYLRSDMMPHIWCPGCGLGIVLKAYVKALEKAEVPLDKRVVVSGIGCSGRSAGYLNQDSYHTTHGRPIAFATGMKLANPDLNVTVISGDGDLFAIGGNHFIHAARRNIDMNVICVNNFNYGMTGGQAGPTTPTESKTVTTPYGNFEHPFNLPHLAASSGAVYVARWTTLDARRLRDSIAQALKKRGFTFIEVISPCPIGYGRPNRIGEGREEMKMYQENWDLREDNWIIQESANPRDADIELKKNIMVGVFCEVDRATFMDHYLDMEPIRKKRLKHMVKEERTVRE